MAIQLINNQPIDFRTSLPSDSECKAGIGCNDFCTPYNNGDPIIFQFKQTPCDTTNILCAPNLENTNPEKVSNGDFDTNGSWTFGTGWAWDSVNKRAKRTSGSNGVLTQTLGITSGKSYVVTFRIDNGFSSTQIFVRLGNTLHTPGFNVSGTYSVIITAGVANTLISFETSNSLAWVDNVSVREVFIGPNSSYCLYSNTPNSWIQNTPTSITHIPGSADGLYTDVTATANNPYYKFTISITGMSAGTLDVSYFDGSSHPLGTITTNGNYTFWLQPSISVGQDVTMGFVPSSDFDGTISSWGMYNMTVTFPINLVPVSGGASFNMNSGITYQGEYVTVNWIIPMNVPAKQYEICLFDICGGNANKQMIPDYDFQTCDWNYTNALCGGGSFQCKANDPSDQIYWFSPIAWDADMYTYTAAVFDYQIVMKQVDVPGSNLYLINTFDNSLLATLALDVQSGATYSGQVTIYANPAGFTPEFKLIMTNTPAGGDVVEFESISLILQSSFPGEGVEYCSNCLDIAQTHKCTQWIAGDCDQRAFGFDFSGSFQIAGRVRCMFLNPKYKGELQRYADAGGTFTLTRAASNKIYQFLIDYSPERTHDWIRLALLCDEIHIGAAYNSYRTWINTEGDYQPEWPDNLGNYPLAQCRVELQEKTDELYNNNAG